MDSIRTAAGPLKGVIVMRFKEEGDHVISLALTDHEEGSAEGRGIRPSGSRGENALPECLSEHRGSCSRGDGSPFKTIFQKDFMMKTVTIYTERLLRQSGPGGWGAI